MTKIVCSKEFNTVAKKAKEKGWINMMCLSIRDIHTSCEKWDALTWLVSMLDIKNYSAIAKIKKKNLTQWDGDQ